MNATVAPTSILSPVIARFLTLKWALGRGYDGERRVLAHLDGFLASTDPDAADLTPATFNAWCQTLTHLRSGVRRSRMRVVRNLCLYRRRTEPTCFVPDPALFPPLHQPVRPYLFTEAEVGRLIRTATALTPTAGSPLRPEVMRLGLVLLYTAGLRRGELLRLCLGDLDLVEHTLWVRTSKFHKSRLLPLSKGAFGELEHYLEVRRTSALPSDSAAPLLCHRQRGGPGYTGTGFRGGLCHLLWVAGIRTPAGRLPRVHDFRHSFAVRALLRWYQAGADVQAKLPLLATYMGHVSIASTEYYLPFVADLAAAAGERFERYAGGLVTPGPALQGGER
jgi:integrase